MPKQCPPGVICLENMTLVVVLIVLFVVGFLIHVQFNKKNNSEIIIHNSYPTSNKGRLFSNLSSNEENDVLFNPYVAPMVNNMPPTTGDPRGLPINIKTQGRNTQYQQLGILTRVNGPETILPLMGRETIAGRDKWQFYTISDKNNSVKLPISSNGKSCTGEYGCNSLYNGDTVYVEGYNDAFKITMYENNTMQYIPYI